MDKPEGTEAEEICVVVRHSRRLLILVARSREELRRLTDRLTSAASSGSAIAEKDRVPWPPAPNDQRRERNVARATIYKIQHHPAFLSSPPLALSGGLVCRHILSILCDRTNGAFLVFFHVVAPQHDDVLFSHDNDEQSPTPLTQDSDDTRSVRRPHEGSRGSIRRFLEGPGRHL